MEMHCCTSLITLFFFMDPDYGDIIRFAVLVFSRILKQFVLLSYRTLYHLLSLMS